MLFGLYLMFELFLLIGYFAYSYDHITGYTRVRKHPREMHPAEYLIGITIDLNGQIMLSDILIYPANASSVFYLRCGWSLLLLAALTGFLLFFKKLTAERRYLAANSIHLGLQAIIIFLFLIGFKTA